MSIHSVFDIEMGLEKMEYLKSLKRQLTNSKDPAMVFHLAITIFFIKNYDQAIYFTGKMVPEMLREMKGQFEKATMYEFMSAFLSDVIAQRKDKSINLDDKIIQLKQYLK